MLRVLSGLVCWTGAKWSLSVLIPNSHWMGFISPTLLVQKEIRIRIASSAPSWDTDTAERGLISPFLPTHMMIWSESICPSTDWTSSMDNSFEQDTEVLGMMHLRRLFFVCLFVFPKACRQCEVCIRKKLQNPVSEIYISVKYFCPRKTKMPVQDTWMWLILGKTMKMWVRKKGKT